MVKIHKIILLLLIIILVNMSLEVPEQTNITSGNGYLTSFSIINPNGTIIVIVNRSHEVIHLVPHDEITPSDHNAESTGVEATGGYGTPPDHEEEQAVRLNHGLAIAPKSEIHNESNGFEIVHLNGDKSIRWKEPIQHPVSNGSETMAFDHEGQLLAITHDGGMISIFNISLDEQIGSKVVETFDGGHKRKTTALSIGLRSGSIRRIARGDSIGNIKVYEIDLKSPNSARCIGRVDDTTEQNRCFNDVSSIISFNWSNQTLWSTNSKGKFWIIDTSIDQTWEIKTPGNQKSPSMLNAVSNTIPMSNVTNVLIHPSNLFLVMVCSSGKKHSSVTTHPIPITHDASSLVGISNYSCTSFVRSMTFDNTGSILFLGCSKMIIALRVSPNGDTMTELWSHRVGNDRYISSLVLDKEGESLTASDLSGCVVSLKLLS